MKRISVCILILVFAASCGGGEAPAPNDNAPVTEEKAPEPKPPELSEEDKFAVEEFEALKRLLKDAEAKYPGISDYERLVAEVKSDNDGGERFLKAIRPADGLSILGENAPWRHLLNIGNEGFEENFGRRPRDSDREEALSQSNWIPVVCREHLSFDTITVFALVDDDRERAMDVLNFMTMPTHRARLLLELGKPIQAARELTEFFRLVALFDVYTSWASDAYRYAVITTNIYRLVATEMSILADDAGVVKALSALRVGPATSFKRYWRSDLVRSLWRLKQAESADEWWEDVTPTEDIRLSLQFHVATYGAFPDGAPNPFDPTSYAKAIELAESIGGKDRASNFAGLVHWRLRTECLWLAWDLFHMDKAEPLLTRKQAAMDIIATQPWCKADWIGNELKLLIDADHPISRDADNIGASRDMPVLTLPLREVAPEEEKQPD